MPKSARVPKYSLHRATGQARVCIDGRDQYLGQFGSPESHARYQELIDAWRLLRQLPYRPRLTVGDLVVLYDSHATNYYRKDGEPTSEPACIRQAMRPLLDLYRRELASEFGPRKLRDVREQMIKLVWSRTTINKHIRRIRQMFRWAVSEELLPSDAFVKLQTVPGLKKGRSDAKESSPVLPVDDDRLEKVAGLVSPQIAAMIRLQSVTGMRPGEVVAMRADEILTVEQAWEYVPRRHKTEHHGKDRRIFIGPRGQKILRPYLEAARPDAYLFPPIDGGEHYSTDSYRRAIHRACRRAKIPTWSPNQIRHTFATSVRREFGIETAQVILGHSSLTVTQVYAERDFAAASSAIQRVG